MSADTSPASPTWAPDNSPPPDPFLVAADLFDPPPHDPGRWRPHEPHPPQAAFLDLDCEEALYGGAAGGGKSDALLMAALQYVNVPGYAALILRKTFADLELPGAIMHRAQAWLIGTGAQWNANRKTFVFPSGATLTFGYLQTEQDKYRYQGAEFNFVAFDELTQFDEADYVYLLSRLRRPDAGPLSRVPIRLRAATNPGGRGHRWVKRRFIDRQPRPDDPEDTPQKCAARAFVPAKLDDNPSVDREAYTSALGGLDPQTRAQLLSGDWNAREPGDWVFPIGLDEAFVLGARFDVQRNADRMRPPVGDATVLCADWGVHAHLLNLWPLEAGGTYAVRETVNDTASIRTVAPRVAAEVKALGWPVFSERFDASMPGLNDAFMERLRPLLPWAIKTLAIPFGKYKALTIDYLRLLVGNSYLQVRHPGGAGLAELPELELRTVAKGVGEQHQAEDVTTAEIVKTLTVRATVGPVLAVSERGCPVLADQLRGWRYADPDAGRTEKGDDHGPDALVAGVAPEAAKRRRKT